MELFVDEKKRSKNKNVKKRILYKKAELSQRRPRDAPNIWVPEKFPESWLAHGYFSRNLLWVFVPIDTKNVHTKLEVRSFSRSWDNGGRVLKKILQSLDTPTLPFLPNF